MRLRDKLFKRLDSYRLTPTQRKLLRVLCDGEPHSGEKLHAYLPDELSERRAIHKHLDNLKLHLEQHDLILRCVLVGGKQGPRPHYQIVRHVRSLVS